MAMIALKPIKKGEQIFNDFGQLPRSDLLRRYGYITDRYKKWDVVEVDIEAITTATAEHNSLSKSEKEQRVPTQWTCQRPMKSLMCSSFASLLTGKFYRMAMI